MSYTICNCCHLCKYSFSLGEDNILICGDKEAEKYNLEVSHFGTCENLEENKFND